jgi:hypothetical protein
MLMKSFHIEFFLMCVQRLRPWCRQREMDIDGLHTRHSFLLCKERLKSCFTYPRIEFRVCHVCKISFRETEDIFCKHVRIYFCVARITQPYPISHRINPKILSVFSLAHKHQQVFRSQFPRERRIQIELTRERERERDASISENVTTRSLPVVSSPPPHL